MNSVQYKKTKNGKWYFTVTADNGKQLVSSQKTYESKRNARIGFDALIKVLAYVTLEFKLKNPEFRDQKFKNTAPYGKDTR
jgi:uncharacterized protein YegP (UPF0339 family)